VRKKLTRKLGVTTMWFELSLNTDLQAVALNIAPGVINNASPMMAMITTTMTLTGTVDRPHSGLSLPGHKSNKNHHHALLDVLHVTSGQKNVEMFAPGLHLKGITKCGCFS
jgi:hypothetical protein